MPRWNLTEGAALGILAILAPTAPAADARAIQQAIDRGVQHLKGVVPIVLDGHSAGTNALIGLTLLECGAAASDPAVERAADIVRPASVTLAHTYSVALAILFLDRLGDPADGPVIQSLGVRLLAGQNAAGG